MKKERVYKYIYVRVEYPYEWGYRMEAKALPDYMYITIAEKDGSNSKIITVHSRIHVEKSSVIGPSYSKDWTDQEILKDQSGSIEYLYAI